MNNCDIHNTIQYNHTFTIIYQSDEKYCIQLKLFAYYLCKQYDLSVPLDYTIPDQENTHAHTHCVCLNKDIHTEITYAYITNIVLSLFVEFKLSSFPVSWLLIFGGKGKVSEGSVQHQHIKHEGRAVKK